MDRWPSMGTDGTDLLTTIQTYACSRCNRSTHLLLITITLSTITNTGTDNTDLLIADIIETLTYYRSLPITAKHENKISNKNYNTIAIYQSPPEYVITTPFPFNFP
jgi:hypothetical protein